MTATDHTDNFFAGAKVKNFKVRNYSHFTITFLTIWRGTGDFLKVLLKFQRAAMNELHNFCGHKSQKLKSEMTHILQPHYHPQVYFLNIFDRKNSYLIRAGDDIGLRASCKVQVYISIYNNMQITIHISSTLSQHWNKAWRVWRFNEVGYGRELIYGCPFCQHMSVLISRISDSRRYPSLSVVIMPYIITFWFW